MKKLLTGIAFGMVAGCLLSQVPEVQDLLDTGKRKIKKLVK